MSDKYQSVSDVISESKQKQKEKREVRQVELLEKIAFNSSETRKYTYYIFIWLVVIPIIVGLIYFLMFSKQIA